MSAEPEGTPILAVALFESVRDKLPFQTTTTWEKLIPLLSRHEERETKDGRLWSPVLYREGATRGVEGVIAVYALVLDFDNGEPTEAYRELWEGFVYHVHSTFSHTWEAPKWRAVFPLASPVPAAEWPATWRRLVSGLCDTKADPSCKDASRIFYLPACPVGDGVRFAATYEGEGWIDPTDLRAFPAPPPPTPAPLAPLAYVALPGDRDALGEKLAAGALAEAFRHGRHKGAVWLGVQCHANGFTESECVQLALREYCPRLWSTNTKGEVEPFAKDFPEAPIAWAYRQAPKEPWAAKMSNPDRNLHSRVVRGAVETYDRDTGEVVGTVKTRELPGKVQTYVVETGEVLEEAPLVEEEEQEAEPAPFSLDRGYTARWLQQTDIPDPKMVVSGLFVVGLNLLVGHSKTGKSFAMQQVAVAVATGGKAFSRFDVEQGDVLYIALEDGKGRIKRRLSTLFPDGLPWPETLTFFDEWPRMDTIGRGFVSRWLKEHEKAKLIVIDTWNAVRCAHGKGGDLVYEDYHAFNQMRHVAQDHGVALVVVHHASQGASADSVNAGAGTHGLPAAADAILNLTKKRGEHEAGLEIIGRDVPEQKWILDRDKKTGFWSAKGDATEIQTSRERGEILEIIASFAPSGVSYKEIAHDLGKNAKTIYELCRRMVEEGILENGGGSFRLSRPDRPLGGL